MPSTPADIEEQFLAMLEAAPSDESALLVYADWLEGQGLAERADFLRVSAKLVSPNLHRKKGPQLVTRLRKLATPSDVEWRARISRALIEGCGVEFQFRCPKQWSSLTTTEKATIRRCGACERTVHYCATLPEVLDHARAGDCVAFDPMLITHEAGSAYHRARGIVPADDMMEIGEIRRA